MEKTLIDTLWVILCANLVFLMQAGFLCLEAGTTRSKNNINVVIKNIADFGVSVLLFWLFGFALMFGTSQAGWIGFTKLAPEFTDNNEVWGIVFFLFQVMFCSTAVTIVSGAVAERMRFGSYLIMAALVSGIIYPMFGHWAWNGLSDTNTLGWLEARGFIDFAGSTVVHSVGGWVALAAVLILGPRIGRFSPKRYYRGANGADLPLASLGVLLLWLGWFGFNGGSALVFDQTVPGIIANTILGGCGGLMTPILLSVLTHQLVRVGAVMNGALAGLVAITANCHAVHAGSAVLIGIVGSLVMLATESLLERLHIDDVVGAIPVHLGAGIWGTLAVALFGDLTLMGTGLNRLQQLQVQALGVLVCAIWTFGVAYLMLLGCDRLFPLRVSHRNEHIGLNISEHGASTDLVDLFTVMHRQERTGDLQLRVHADAFTPVGQIARRYNRVIASLEEITARTDAIVKTAIDAILTVSKSGLIIQTANPAVEPMFGVSATQLVGEPLTCLVQATTSTQDQSRSADAQLSFLSTCLSRAIADGTPYEMLGQRRSGTPFPVEITVNEVQTSQETFYTIVLRDITLRKQAEEAIQQAEAQDRKSRRLEQALVELKRTQSQLVQSEKMSSLGLMVAGVAHEINNPVNFIYGNLEYATQVLHDLLDLVTLYQSHYPQPTDEVYKKIKALDLDFLQQDMPELFDSMKVGTERIQEIVSALRIFSRLDESGTKIADVHQGIDSTLMILQNRLKETCDRPAIQVIKAYSELPPIECYPGQLNQVFMNILVNAIDALEERDARRTYDEIDAHPSTIWISTEPIDADWIAIRIADDGLGIDANTQAHLFDPFYTTKPVGKGTGLGLSISYRIIVEEHGGKLDFASEPGKGTEFIIKLPVEQPTR